MPSTRSTAARVPTHSTRERDEGRLPTPPSPRPHATCWSRSSARLPAPFPPECGAAGVASVEADYAAALGAIPDGRAKTRGIEVGQAAAAAILALRAADGADTPLIDTDYPQGTSPGEYRFTPGTPFAFAPGWGDVTPFVLRDSSQFRPGPPYAVTSRKYTADFNEVKRLGGDGVTTPSARTAEQTEIALFWVESSPLQWNRIARAVSADTRLDLWEQARLFGLLNMALADGYIGSFDTKYHYNYWRPVTAIQTADTDGNPNTSADPTWTPLVTTPPIPDYDSAHSVEGGAAAKVLKRFFGTDHISFETCSLTLPAGSTCDRPVARPAPLHQLLPSGRGERALAHPRRVPLPQGGRRRDRARPQDRRPRRRPLPAALELRAHHATQRGPAERGLAHLQGARCAAAAGSTVAEPFLGVHSETKKSLTSSGCSDMELAGLEPAPGCDPAALSHAKCGLCGALSTSAWSAATSPTTVCAELCRGLEVSSTSADAIEQGTPTLNSRWPPSRPTPRCGDQTARRPRRASG